MKTDMDYTPTNYGKSSMRILNKGPDYFRSTSINSQNSDGKKKTAAERLAADKLKYVKSAKARQLQKLSDMSPSSHNNDSTGSHSMGTSSTGSPMNIEDDDSDITHNTTPESYQPLQDTQISNTPSRGLSRANTNADTRSRDRFRNKQRNRSVSEQFTNSRTVNSKCGETAVNQLRLNRSDAPKNTTPTPVAKNNYQSNTNKPKPVKTFSSYLNKAKEGIKAVTSNIAGPNGVAEVPDTPKGRQSRPTKSRTSKYRSASVGAGVFQKREITSQVIHPVSENKSGAESPTMSPRTQLKHVRQNLKKVNSTPSAITNLADENQDTKYKSPSHKPVGKTFTVNPKQVDQNTFLRSKNPTKDTSNMPRALRGRPLSVIENRSGNNFSKSLNLSQSEQKLRRRSASSGKYVESDGNDINFGDSLNSKNLIIENRLNIQAQNLKRRSWDLSHAMDNSLQLSLAKPISLTPEADMMLTSDPPLTQTPRQRKSWSRVPPSTSEYRKSQEFSQNRNGPRKNIAEALEEIFTPLEDDDMDTAYHSMSPDASMECKTLVNQEKGKDSKTPESSRTSTGSQSANSSGGNDVDISKNPDISPQAQVYPEERLWSTYRNNLAAQQSQPLNRIDLAPSNAIHNSHSSPMLAPKSRREVAPDYASRNPTNSLTRNAKEESLNNLRAAQNTSSSVSVDASKPFTALTASDLKPRRTKRNVMTHATTPLKPTYPYSVQPHNLRMNTKRHNNAPISPTLSPHKQAARMGSHGSRSSSSTPYSSLKRTPTSSNSKSSSLKRNRQRSKSDVSLFQFELDRFFSSMGMEECLISPLPDLNDTLFTTAHVSSESDFSFAGASAYVRDSPDESLPMEVDPMTAGLAHVPAVSIIEKNARVTKWLIDCKKSGIPASPSVNKTPESPRIPVSVPYRDQEQNQNSNSYTQNKNNKNRNYEVIIDKRHHSGYSRKPSSPQGVQLRSHISPPPIPPRLHSSYQPAHNPNGHPKESDV